ncbi:MAG TPA: hypothetical protein DIU15_10645 [Deltaproteobacteria bacterium]|nr:hypothetical protein [Deltaproteobacteria bacterium]HCP46494.1 hypothetical protein [Deltaproteobacteria bacterium]
MNTRNTHLITRMTVVFLATVLSACTNPLENDEMAQDEVDNGVPELPEFVEDCDERINDSIDNLSGLVGDNNQRYENLELCDGDVDWYRVDIAPERWLSVEIMIHGSGANLADNSDLDLYETDSDGDEIWWSAVEEDYERLAWYNPSDQWVSRYLKVDAYGGAAAEYDIEIKRSKFHDGLNCDDYYEDESPSDEGGPCNRIMQFPQMNSDADGYVVSHWAHYSNLRREVTYLVRYAAAQTAAHFEDTNPLGLLDMSERDGDTPGRMVGQLRHPEGTHVEGNDIDIAYYQTGEDNLGRSVCPEDGYFCTGDPHILDAERTVFFMSKLAESNKLRVLGVDPRIASALKDEADSMEDDGVISTADRNFFFSNQLAYGDGWPFHQHHMHLSWQWESGHQGREVPVDGCMTGPDVPLYERPRIEPVQ